MKCFQNLNRFRALVLPALNRITNVLCHANRGGPHGTHRRDFRLANITPTAQPSASPDTSHSSHSALCRTGAAPLGFQGAGLNLNSNLTSTSLSTTSNQALSSSRGVYLYMQLLLEQNQKHSRQLFFACLLIGAALSPLVLHLVDRSMSDLHPAHTKPQPAPDSNSSQWVLRSM